MKIIDKDFKKKSYQVFSFEMELLETLDFEINELKIEYLSFFRNDEGGRISKSIYVDGILKYKYKYLKFSNSFVFFIEDKDNTFSYLIDEEFDIKGIKLNFDIPIKINQYSLRFCFEFLNELSFTPTTLTVNCKWEESGISHSDYFRPSLGALLLNEGDEILSRIEISSFIDFLNESSTFKTVFYDEGTDSLIVNTNYLSEERKKVKLLLGLPQEPDTFESLKNVSVIVRNSRGKALCCFNLDDCFGFKESSLYEICSIERTEEDKFEIIPILKPTSMKFQ